MQLSIKMLENKKKLSLALSGGGFRASFFHLGVLSKLAQLGILGHIKIISTVSGGSVIGALYYQELLKVINLKQGNLEKEDYIKVVQYVEDKFATGVAKNIRGKLFFNPWYEIQALFIGRERVLSKLYKKYLYKSDVEMSELRDNYGIAPKLIINATSLNNGKHWFFSQDEMGQYDESGTSSSYIIGYENTPIKLCDAVTASSAVPGLLNYVNFKNLNNTKLVDGGVIDNLGVYALMKESVDFMIISDASRPLIIENQLQKRRLSILKRGYDASLVFSRKLILDAIPEDQKLYLSTDDVIEQLPQEITCALANIRTDLNDFHRYESKLLCFYGYNSAGKYFEDHVPAKQSFLFEEISAHLNNQQYLMRVLKSGANLSKTGGNLLQSKNKGWISKIEGFAEFWRNINNPFIAIFLVIVHVFGIAFLQGIIGMIFKSNEKTIQTSWMNILLGILIISLVLNIRKSIGEILGNKIGNLIDNIILKLVHGLGVLLLLLNVLFIVVTLIVVIFYLFTISRILGCIILVALPMLIIIRSLYKKRTSYHWSLLVKKNK